VLAILDGQYWHARGVPLGIHAACLDSGYNTDVVYKFVRQHAARRLYATKGVAGRTGEPLVLRTQDKRLWRQPRGRLYLVNADAGKADVMASLDQPPGPGALHFPAHVGTINAEFFEQLVAEHQEIRYNKAGVAVAAPWVQHRDRNEALDLVILATAAYEILNPRLHEWQAAVARLQPERGLA
jgi:phage terminase large subunit GpA-like protein